MPSQIARMAPASQAVVLSRILGIGAIIAVLLPPVVGRFGPVRLALGPPPPVHRLWRGLQLLGLFLMWSAARGGSTAAYLAGFLVVQFGANMATSAFNGVIPDMVPASQRGTASGYMGAMTGIGTILGAVGAGFLLDKRMDTVAYAVIAVAQVGFLGITFASVREQPLACRPAPLHWRPFLKTLWIDPRRTPTLDMGVASRAAVTMGVWTVQPFLQYYLRDAVGLKNPERMTATCWARSSSEAPSRPWPAESFQTASGGNRSLTSPISCVRWPSLGFLFTHNLAAVFAVGVVYGLGYGAYNSVDNALWVDVLPDKDNAAAKDMGLWQISNVLPQCIAPVIAARCWRILAAPPWRAGTRPRGT
jgi:ABC-type sugar transport system permease subunit